MRTFWFYYYFSFQFTYRFLILWLLLTLTLPYSSYYYIKNKSGFRAFSSCLWWHFIEVRRCRCRLSTRQWASKNFRNIHLCNTIFPKHNILLCLAFPNNFYTSLLMSRLVPISSFFKCFHIAYLCTEVWTYSERKWVLLENMISSRQPIVLTKIC